MRFPVETGTKKTKSPKFHYNNSEIIGIKTTRALEDLLSWFIKVLKNAGTNLTVFLTKCCTSDNKDRA